MLAEKGRGEGGTGSEQVSSQRYTRRAETRSAQQTGKQTEEYERAMHGVVRTLSMSEIIFLISSFLGSKPSARMATLSSLASMVPEPSVSNRSKASRISCFCSSVSSNFLFLEPPFALDACRKGGQRGQ